MKANEVKIEQNVMDFLLANKADLTFQSKVTGKYFSYKIRAARDNKNVHFVSAFTGTDNETCFKYMACIFINPDNSATLRWTKASKVSSDALIGKTFKWVWEQTGKCGDNILKYVNFFRSNKCQNCGKKLTTPESILTGFGPECSKRLGITRICK